MFDDWNVGLGCLVGSPWCPRVPPQVVEVPVQGDTLPGQQQRSVVELPVLRREAPPEVRMEVVQGAPRALRAAGWSLGVGLVVPCNWNSS